jgi:hypothetical protein
MSAELGLRDRARWVSPTDAKILIEAADEIERLRDALLKLRGMNFTWINEIVDHALNDTAEG